MDLDAFKNLHVTLEDQDRRVALRLNHGKVNACGSAVIAELEALAAQIEADTRVQTLVCRSDKVTASGKPIFVAGADVTERADWTDDQVAAHVSRQRNALLRLRLLPVFSVVLVEGLALGLGTELMLAFDYRIATPAAAFALPETGLGIIPGALGTALLSSAIGINQALRLGCSGERIAAEEAARIGLVDELQADAAAARQRADALAAQVGLKSPRAIAAFKAAALGNVGQVMDRIKAESNAYLGQLRNGDAAVGRAAFKDIRAGVRPDWEPRQGG